LSLLTKFSAEVLVPLEILNIPLVFYSGSACFKGTEVAPALRLWVHFARIQAILTGADLANHGLILLTDILLTD
jgi:hypothetical protein